MKFSGLFLAFLLCSSLASAKSTIIDSDKVFRVEKNGEAFIQDQLICSLAGLDKTHPSTVGTLGSPAVIGNNIYLFSSAATRGKHDKEGHAALFRVDVMSRQCSLLFARTFAKGVQDNSGDFVVDSIGNNLVFWHKSHSALQFIRPSAPSTVEVLYDAATEKRGSFRQIFSMSDSPVFLLETTAADGRGVLVYDKNDLKLISSTLFPGRLGLNQVKYVNDKIRLAFFLDQVSARGSNYYVFDYRYGQNTVESIAFLPMGTGYNSSVVKIVFSKFEDFFFITQNDGPNIRNMETLTYNWKTKQATSIFSRIWPAVFPGGLKLANSSQYGFVTNNSIDIFKFDSSGQFVQVQLPVDVEHLVPPYALDEKNHLVLTYQNTTRNLKVFEFDYSQNPIVLKNTYTLPSLRESKSIKSVVLKQKTLHFYSSGADRQTYVQSRTLP
ncbi:hypothetical protein [Bdellovibrio bacteriovorus]|uniref:Uncharacterized protein n=1 Tax=Bdellovibrio bacteriovorus str. Tiberius TaxID=1069642 RepID=K7Z8V5_BDEBC|nr:hypothetical protein [Bdellovibrio bacteriovorus]AFY00899.1 Hypothetical protein Bdt_1200 [Bdellovibrio bacteriovorus str. Tiberius]